MKDALKGKGGSLGGRRVNEDGLNAEQEEFCQLYASDREFFGNGTQSYIEAYDIKVGIGKGCTSYDTCKYRAHQLLTNPRVLKRIDEILEDGGLNNTFVDKQLKFLITQSAEFRPKLGAIQEYNKLKGRITELHKHDFGGLEKLTDAEVKARKEELESFFKKKPVKKK